MIIVNYEIKLGQIYTLDTTCNVIGPEWNGWGVEAIRAEPRIEFGVIVKFPDGKTGDVHAWELRPVKDA